jgi:hypothetical protein
VEKYRKKPNISYAYARRSFARLTRLAEEGNSFAQKALENLGATPDPVVVKNGDGLPLPPELASGT